MKVNCVCPDKWMLSPQPPNINWRGERKKILVWPHFKFIYRTLLLLKLLTGVFAVPSDNCLGSQTKSSGLMFMLFDFALILSSTLSDHHVTKTREKSRNSCSAVHFYEVERWRSFTKCVCSKHQLSMLQIQVQLLTFESNFQN